MPKEIPSNLLDYIIHEHISLGRYASRESSDIIALLNAADKEIVAKIIKRGESSTFTARRLNALLDEIRKMVSDTYDEAYNQLSGDMHDLSQLAADSTAAMLAAQVPKSFSIVGLSKEQLLAIIDKTPISIGKDKKLLLEEIFHKLAAGKEEAIRGALRLGMVEGETVPQMVRRLQGSRASRYSDGIFEKHRKDAESIVRTVVQHTNNQAVQDTYANNSAVVKGWIYVATLDSRTCSYCWSNSGKSFPLGEGPTPPRHVNCRCFAAPYIKSWKELGVDLAEMPPSTRASKNGPVSSDISFEDWLKGQDPGTQAEVLGPSRQKLFADGGLKLDKFTDASGQLYTLDELKTRQKAAFSRAFG